MNQEPHKGTKSENDHTKHGLLEQLSGDRGPPLGMLKDNPRAQSSISPTAFPSWDPMGAVSGDSGQAKQRVTRLASEP